MKDLISEKMYTIKEISDFCQLSYRTIHRYLKSIEKLVTLTNGKVTLTNGKVENHILLKEEDIKILNLLVKKMNSTKSGRPIYLTENEVISFLKLTSKNSSILKLIIENKKLRENLLENPVLKLAKRVDSIENQLINSGIFKAIEFFTRELDKKKLGYNLWDDNKISEYNFIEAITILPDLINYLKESLPNKRLLAIEEKNSLDLRHVLPLIEEYFSKKRSLQ
jgi:hypothetical protein